VVAFVSAFRSYSLAAWSMGVAFIVYDLGHLVFVGVAARKLFAPPAREGQGDLSLAVVVAAYNEAPALGPTLDALLAQSRPPDQILLADDGSDDDSAAVLASRYGLVAPPPGGLAHSPTHPSLFWLRLPHRGKARALNAALEHVTAEIVATVDADTILEPDALAHMRHAFAADPALVVAGGVLEPRCRGGALAVSLQTFQRYEYVRNFLARYAWSGLESLLLISGAFAGFRTQALREVGGFDAECLVEDYELIHRLHRRAREQGGIAKVRIVGRAFASTDAPATLAAFLSQRRRWFAGFLQTQYWNRDMIGAPRYGALGLAMLPFKCLDAAAPLYGLAAFGLMLMFVAQGRLGAALPAGGLALAKLGFDLANIAYSLQAYRRWTGVRLPLGLAWLCLLIEPLTFQPLRHLGAARGWAALLAGRTQWGGASRAQGRTARNSSAPSL
jgi:cellulose synthase/poly-beta-1,6-N-acetylglucosamine synthase-like glycosyltransferase